MNIKQLNQYENDKIITFFSDMNFTNTVFLHYWEDIDPMGALEYTNCLFIVTQNEKSIYILYDQYKYVERDSEFSILKSINPRTKERLLKEDKYHSLNDFSLKTHQIRFSVLSKLKDFE